MEPTQTPVPDAAAAAAAAAATSAAAAPVVDEFAAAFDELHTAATTAPAATPVPDATPAAATASAAAPALAPATPAIDTAAPAATPAAPAAAPAAPAAAPEGFVSAAQFAELQAQFEAWKTTPVAVPAAPAPAAPAAPVVPALSAEEQTALEQYHTDYPDVARGEAIQRSIEYKQLVAHIFGQLQPQIAALQDRLPAVEDNVQLRDLKELIPDYEVVREPVIEWVGKQPSYLKTAYEQVTSKGTPEEIADLVARFKKETSWAAPAAAAPATQPVVTPAAAPAAAPAATVKPAAATPAPAANAALPAAAAAAAASLKPVKTGRTEPASGQDPNDFDSAWKEITAQA